MFSCQRGLPGAQMGGRRQDHWARPTVCQSNHQAGLAPRTGKGNALTLLDSKGLLEVQNRAYPSQSCLRTLGWVSRASSTPPPIASDFSEAYQQRKISGRGSTSPTFIPSLTCTPL